MADLDPRAQDDLRRASDLLADLTTDPALDHALDGYVRDQIGELRNTLEDLADGRG